MLMIFFTLAELKRRFAFGKSQQGKFVHVGMQIEQEEDFTVVAHQRDYAESIEAVATRTAMKGSVSLSQHRDLRRLVGELLWLSCSTRPDIAVDVSMLGRHLTEPTLEDIWTANGVLANVKKTAECGLTFKKLNGPLSIAAITDAAFNNVDGEGSQAGYVIAICEKQEQCEGPATIPRGTRIESKPVSSCLLSWKSARIQRVVNSTLAAETMSALGAFDMASAVRNLFEEVVFGNVRCLHAFSPTEAPHTDTHLKTDCRSMIDSVDSPERTQGETPQAPHRGPARSIATRRAEHNPTHS